MQRIGFKARGYRQKDICKVKEQRITARPRQLATNKWMKQAYEQMSQAHPALSKMELTVQEQVI